MNYTTRQIADITNSKLIGDETIIVKSIAFDSRTLYSIENKAFIAIKTSQNNGENYINSVIEKGINVIISENKTCDHPNVTWIIVKNCIEFLQLLASSHRNQFPNLKTIGITGSNGKTIIKEWLYQCLWNEFSTVKSPKSFNSQIGLPLSLLKTDIQHEIGLFEVGISKPGEMERQQKVFSPDIGILTHIGNAHLVNFESIEQLIDEKLLLFKDSKLIIYNSDHKLIHDRIRNTYPTKRLISYGFEDFNDVQIISNPDNEWIQVNYFSEIIRFKAQKRDSSTLSNVLAVIIILKDFGFSNDQIIDKINTLRSVEMRLESIDGLRNNLIINDSFNFDIDSLKIALEYIGEYNKPKKTLVLTDIIESVKDIDKTYKEIAQLVNSKGFDTVILIGEEITNCKNLFQSDVLTFTSTKELINSNKLNEIQDSIILLKGARKFEFERLKTELELQKHDTTLEVNLNSILHNINIHKSFLSPKTKIMAMVKAQSYGLGGYEIAEFLQHHHIDYLGVAYADEGVELRKKGITVPIIVMNPEQHSYDSIIDYNLEPEIYSFRVLDLFYNRLVEKGIDKKYPIHIKLETGMHRLGFKSDEINSLIHKLNTINLRVASIFSHLSSADIPNEVEYTKQQLELFKTNSELLMMSLGYFPIRHILNSSGITSFNEYQFDMVRIGIGMFGISFDENIQKKLQNVVVLKTVISQISIVKRGDSIGYSRKYIAEKDTKIATIPVGYADGIPRLIGNKIGFINVRGKLFPIVGNICMDMLMVDIGDEKAKEGDEVIIFGKNPSLTDFSKYCNTIPYEVLTSISRRVKRIYIKN